MLGDVPAGTAGSSQRAVVAAAESAAPRFLGVLSVIFPAGLLIQAVTGRSDYWLPAVPVVVWLGMLAVAGWLVPRACARGLSRAESVAAITVAVAAVAAVDADRRPGAPAVGLILAIMGTVWLLALAAVSCPAWVWVPGAAAILGVHAVFALRQVGGSPLGLSRVVGGGYAVFIIPAVFAALQPMLRTHASIALRRAGLASQARAERAAVAAIQADRRDRLALLEAEALPLLAGIASGTLDPASTAVREQCGRHAATLRATLVRSAPPGLLAGLAPALTAARRRGLPVSVQVLDDPRPPGSAVTRATLAAVDTVLRSLPVQPVTITVLTTGRWAELYLTFGRAPGCQWDFTALGQEVPAEEEWAADADAEEPGPGCLSVRWRDRG